MTTTTEVSLDHLDEKAQQKLLLTDEERIALIWFLANLRARRTVEALLAGRRNG